VKGLKCDNRDKGSPVSYCHEIAIHSIDNLKFGMVDQDGHESPQVEEIIVDKEIYKEFEIYNIHTILAAEKPMYLDVNIKKEYVNIF
jgi:hypothetical protein